MSSSADALRVTVQSALINLPSQSDTELRALIAALAATLAGDLTAEELEQVARSIEASQGISAGLGAVIDDDDFEPWLDDLKSDIDPFYWNRYKQLLLQNGLPKDVIIATDNVTERILGRLGNPQKNTPWDRRGMVVGHVQSGKTANYTGLICKAADAGYRLIIVIAGIHNNLRNQTQERIDEGFIGRDTGRSIEKNRSGGYLKGVGLFDSNRTPVSLTNTLRDFNKATATTNTSEIDSYKVPVVLVIKKNHSTLKNLIDWLRDNSARGKHDMIDQPMLLIDDEADNASINTAYSKDEVTKINGQIRDLLNCFHRSCYIGYTATPFANIFIDPDQTDEMLKEDLFPKDFIIALDAPSNYFGPKKIFIDGRAADGRADWLRTVTDNEDHLPVSHKIDHVIVHLPDSLIRAVRTFVIARTIRNLRGQSSAHCSMLVNASRFTAIQGDLRNRLHEVLVNIQNAVRISAARGEDGLKDPEIAALKTVWQEEYKNGAELWMNIQAALHDAIASAKVVEVNSKNNDLDYSDTGARGVTVIAVGGFSLSRGLTLEGLTVTWFLRNTKMYDTLMQMGRWFGYRTNYEDLCRIWMQQDSMDWYSFIAGATEELNDELHSMEAARATPEMFGLAVRSHPATLLVTARNKMGSGRKITVQVGLSNQFVETTRVSIAPVDMNANLAIAKDLVKALQEGGYQEIDSSAGPCIVKVPVALIDRFLAGWRNAEQSITTVTDPIRQYIKQRSDAELEHWDVLISSSASGAEDTSLGRVIRPRQRGVDLTDLRHQFMSWSGKRMRAADASYEAAGLDPEVIERVRADYRKLKEKDGNKKISYPGTIYRRVRNRPLFMLMHIQARSHPGQENSNGVGLIPNHPVVSWGMSLPVSSSPAERVEYVVNTVQYRELFGEEDEDQEIQESFNAE